MKRTLVVRRKAQVVEIQRDKGQRCADERCRDAHQQQHIQPRVAPDRKAPRLPGSLISTHQQFPCTRRERQPELRYDDL
jgi:capsular polysaccharide biosynthesis protein